MKFRKKARTRSQRAFLGSSACFLQEMESHLSFLKGQWRICIIYIDFSSSVVGDRVEAVKLKAGETVRCSGKT